MSCPAVGAVTVRPKQRAGSKRRRRAKRYFFMKTTSINEMINDTLTEMINDTLIMKNYEIHKAFIKWW
jgi:hypothetical protein